MFQHGKHVQPGAAKPEAKPPEKPAAKKPMVHEPEGTEPHPVTGIHKVEMAHHGGGHYTSKTHHGGGRVEDGEHHGEHEMTQHMKESFPSESGEQDDAGDSGEPSSMGMLSGLSAEE